MPANDGRHHRTRICTLSVGAAVITLVLAACPTTATSSTSTSSPAPGTTAAAVSSPHITLTGAGSTFDAPFFDLAGARYHQQHSGVTVNYAAVGSGAGITAFSAKQADFGASDVPMTAAEQAAAKGGEVVQVPVDLGAEGVVYNLSLPAGSRLHLTGPVIARIFLGQITSWQDPAITALNPGINLPDARISVVHRADGSGTTYISSNYLSRVSPAWAAKVGAGKSLHWPVGEGAEGNAGVAASVYLTPFSIGYVEQSYSKGLLLPYAAIRNKAGHYVIPSIQTAAADAAQKPAITPAVLRFTSVRALRDFLATGIPPARPDRLAALGDPASTGMTRQDLAGLIQRLSLRQAATAERRKHQRRGGDRLPGTRRGVFTEKITDAERVLAVILGLRKVCSWDVIAELFQVSRRSIGNATAWVRPLLEEDGCTITRSTTRYPTATALLTTTARHTDALATPESPR